MDQIITHNCPHCGGQIVGYCYPQKPLWHDIREAHERGEVIQSTNFSNYDGLYWNAWSDWNPLTPIDWDYYNQNSEFFALRVRPADFDDAHPDTPHFTFNPSKGQWQEWPERFKGKNHIGGRLS